MSVIAEFAIPAEDFILGKALRETTGVSVELEKMVPTGDGTIPYFWVLGDDRERFDAVLEREPELASFTVVDDVDDRVLYRATWNASRDTFVQLIEEYQAVLQEAGGDAECWEFHLRFPDGTRLSDFHTACQDQGIDPTVERLYDPIESNVAHTRDLTEGQRELIEYVYDAGYFEVPRRTTLVEVADELGISDQSVNERLRRGLRALIAATLKSDADP